MSDWSRNEGLAAYEEWVGSTGLGGRSAEAYQPSPIPEALALLEEGFPDEVAQQSSAVFVGAHPFPIVNAFADAPSLSARFAVIYGGLVSATLAYAALYQRFRPLFIDEWRRQSPGGFRPHPEVLELARAVANDVKPAFLGDPVVAQCSRWMKSWNADSVPFPTLAQRNAIPAPDAIMPLTAMCFVVGHEMAHHLLGHTDPNASSGHSHPALEALNTERELRDLALVDGMNPAQSAELDADLFAFFTITRAFVRPDTEIGANVGTWYVGTTGAFVALQALDLAANWGSEEWTHQQRWSNNGPTHPDLNVRIDHIVEAVTSCRYEDGSAIDGSGDPMPHPVSNAIQLTAASELMAQMSP